MTKFEELIKKYVGDNDITIENECENLLSFTYEGDDFEFSKENIDQELEDGELLSEEVAFCVYKFFFNKDSIVYCNYGDSMGVYWVPDKYSLNCDLYFQNLNPHAKILIERLNAKLNCEITIANNTIDPEQECQELEDFCYEEEFWELVIDCMKEVTGCDTVIKISSLK